MLHEISKNVGVGTRLTYSPIDYSNLNRSIYKISFAQYMGESFDVANDFYSESNILVESKKILIPKFHLAGENYALVTVDSTK